MPRITDFCSCVYVLGCKLSVVRLCDIDFGISPVDDITIGITCAAFCFHMTHISFVSSWYLLCLSVIVLVRLYVFGTAMSIKKVFFVFLFMKVRSGRLKLLLLLLLLLRKPEGRRPLGRPRRRWVDNIRMHLQEVGCGYMDWIGLAQDRDRWRTLVSAVMNLRVP